jgi:hypothetical protein
MFDLARDGHTKFSVVAGAIEEGATCSLLVNKATHQIQIESIMTMTDGVQLFAGTVVLQESNVTPLKGSLLIIGFIETRSNGTRGCLYFDL